MHQTCDSLPSHLTLNLLTQQNNSNFRKFDLKVVKMMDEGGIVMLRGNTRCVDFLNLFISVLIEFYKDTFQTFIT